VIIFYNNKTGSVVGTVDGRIHDKIVLENMWIQPGSLKREDISKYVVPFKNKYKIEDQPIKEMRITNTKTLKVEEVVVGKEKVKVGVGMEPDVPFADLITDFETGRKNIYDYSVTLKNGKVTGFKKIK